MLLMLLWMIAIVTLIAALGPGLLWRLVASLPSWAKPNASHVIAFLGGALLLPTIRRVFLMGIRANPNDNVEKTYVYNLEHGRLHLKLPDAMWMNMGYWKDKEARDGHTSSPKTLEKACRDLLIEVLTVAGLSRKSASKERQRGTKKPTCVIDLGFGCGDQVSCLMDSVVPGKEDSNWAFGFCFERYVGLTLDKKQYQFAVQRIRLSSSYFGRNPETPQNTNIHLFCVDAAKPDVWSAELKACIRDTIEKSEVRWVLALDTAYHFSPSRWPVIKHACQSLHASFAAFDLCLSPTASFCQKLILRVFAGIMGAPWKNFVTPEEYRMKLIEAGYDASGITISDISEHVFGPLSEFLERQDRNLRIVGLGIGSFNVARLMFQWWARSGVVRGVIVVARHVRA